MSCLLLVVLLPLPVYAAHRLGVDFIWIGTYTFIASAIAYWVYVIDMRRAEEGLRRIPEAQLHLLEL